MWDKQLMCSDAQALGNIGAAYSTFAIDLGVTGSRPFIGGSPISDLMRGGKLDFVVQMVEAADSADDNLTLKVELVGADLGTDLSSGVVVYDVSLVIAQAALVPNYKFKLNWPLHVTKRFLGCRYTVATTNATAGKVTAGFQFNESTAHPSGT